MEHMPDNVFTAQHLSLVLAQTTSDLLQVVPWPPAFGSGGGQVVPRRPWLLVFWHSNCKF